MKSCILILVITILFTELFSNKNMRFHFYRGKIGINKPYYNIVHCNITNIPVHKQLLLFFYWIQFDDFYNITSSRLV